MIIVHKSCFRLFNIVNFHEMYHLFDPKIWRPRHDNWDIQRIKAWMYARTRVCTHVHSPWHSKSGKIRIYLDWFVRKFEIYIYKRYVIGHLPGFNNVWRPEVVHRSFVRHLYGFLTQKLSIFPGNINLSNIKLKNKINNVQAQYLA